MDMIEEKFRVDLGSHWTQYWPTYFDNFYTHCRDIAQANGWSPLTVMNYQLRPLGGRLIVTKTQGWYLRWDREENHTFFVLKWS
jgi:hypothetical protein